MTNETEYKAVYAGQSLHDCVWEVWEHDEKSGKILCFARDEQAAKKIEKALQERKPIDIEQTAKEYPVFDHTKMTFQGFDRALDAWREKWVAK